MVSSTAKDFFSNPVTTQNVVCEQSDNVYLQDLIEKKQRMKVSDLQRLFTDGKQSFQEQKTNLAGKVSKIELSKNEKIALKNRTRPLPVPTSKKKQNLDELPPLPPRDEENVIETEDLPPPPPPREDDYEERPLPELPKTAISAKEVFQKNSFLKRSFLKVYQFARAVFVYIGKCFYGLGSKFKNITLICIGPFRFRKKVNKGSSIPKAPTFEPGVIPPAPIFNGSSKVNSHAEQDDSYQDHILLKPKDISKNLQDMTEYANSQIVAKRLPEEEEDEEELDFDDWEFSFDFSNGTNIVCEAESDDNITARMQHGLETGKTEVKTYNKLSKKQTGKTVALSKDLLSKAVLKKQDRPAPKKQAEESEPNPQGIFSKAMSKFLDIYDDVEYSNDGPFGDDDDEEIN